MIWMICPTTSGRKPALEAVQFFLPELVQGERVLALEIAVERLPGGFEVVEFGHEFSEFEHLLADTLFEAVEFGRHVGLGEAEDGGDFAVAVIFEV